MGWLSSNADALGALHDLVTMLALSGGLFALWRYRTDVKHQRWLAAKALYSSALDDQINNARFSGKCWSDLEHNLDDRFVYSVFVNKLLWSLEGLIKIDNWRKKTWFNSAIVIAGEHKDFLRDAAEFERDAHLYSRTLRRAITKGAGVLFDPYGRKMGVIDA